MINVDKNNKCYRTSMFTELFNNNITFKDEFFIESKKGLCFFNTFLMYSKVKRNQE